jgi:hypothetical protein
MILPITKIQQCKKRSITPTAGSSECKITLLKKLNLTRVQTAHTSRVENRILPPTLASSSTKKSTSNTIQS